MISEPFLILIWNIGHILTFSFFLNKIYVWANYLQVLFLRKAMILEQNDFCTKEVRFHESEIEVTLQTIFPMDLCSLFFSSRPVTHSGMVLTGLYLFYFKNKISPFVRDGHWSVRQWAPLLNSIFIVSLRSAIAQFLCRAMLCLFSVGRDILRGFFLGGSGERTKLF